VRRARAAAAAALLGLAGCRSLPPSAVPLAHGDPRPGALLSALAARSEALSSLRGLARLAVDGPRGSLRSRQVLIAARPARLRVEVLGFLSQAQALLVTDGASYELWDARERRAERGELRPGLLLEVAGIDLEPEEAVAVLLGTPALEALSLAGAAQVGAARVRVQLADAEGRARRVLEFDSDGELRRLAALDGAGGLLWEARYGDLRAAGATRLAHAIELAFPQSEVEARLELSQVETNPWLPLGSFILELPDGADAQGGG
jgi:hypothetical protein